jgi:hypothetical protein
MIEQLTVSLLRVTYRVLDRPIHFKRFSGPMLRGAFGCALQDVAPEVYQVFFKDPPQTTEAGAGRQLFNPRPYLIKPIESEATRIGPGQSFTFHIGLIGDGRLAHAAVTAACRRMAENGFGPDRSPVVLEKAEWLSASGEVSGEYPAMAPLAVAHDQIRQRIEGLGSADSVSLHLLTPLRVVRHNRLLHPPQLTDIALALTHRLHALARQFCGAAEDPGLAERIIAHAESAGLVEINTRLLAQAHKSMNQKRPVLLEGVVGRLRFERVDPALLPYLVWGEILHIGKNPPYGMGLYRLEVSSASQRLDRPRAML